MDKPAGRSRIQRVQAVRIAARVQMFNSPQVTAAIGTPPHSASVAQTPARRVRLDAGEKRETMRVLLRVRPMKDDEKAVGSCMAVQNETTVHIKAPKDAARQDEATFSFTRVLDTSTSQQQVFETCAAPLVKEFIGGQNGLLFAYGITNAGKTYTIQGSRSEPGLIPRILESIFSSLPPHAESKTPPFAMDPGFRYGIYANYMEIYNENVYDLLSEEKKDERTPLAVKEDKNGRVFVKDLVEKHLKNVGEALAAVALGAKNRQVAATQLNADSSRSHSIFVIKLVVIPRDKDKAAIANDNSIVRTHTLSIVDLAGSERAKKTGADSAQLNQAANINTSLMVFGRCLDIMRSNQQNPSKPPQVVPFRESKLTRLFQDYFIGNGRAVMIVNVSPSASSYGETKNVLHYASLAKEITTMSKLDTGLAPRSAKKRAPGDDDTILDASEKADLQGQIVDLQEKLRHAEAMLLSMESEIRDEVANEMGDSLKAMEKEYEQRRQQELALMEDKYEKKIQLLTKAQQSQQGGVNEGLAAELALMKEKYERVLIELGTPNDKKKSSLSKCKECAALKQKISLMEELAGGLEVKKKEEVEYERRKMAAAAAEDRKQLEANHKIELSTLKAQLEISKREVEVLTATLAKLSAEKTVASSPPANLKKKDRDRDRAEEEKDRNKRAHPASPPARDVVQAAINKENLAAADRKAVPIVVSPKPLLMNPADQSVHSPLDRSISHKDLQQLMDEKGDFVDVPLNTRQPSKQQAGLARIIYKKEEEKREKDKKEEKKKDDKKSKKEEKKDDKREDKKLELMRKTGMSPKMAQQAIKSPDHLSPKIVDTKSRRILARTGLNKPAAKDASPLKKPVPYQAVRLSDVLHSEKARLSEGSENGSPQHIDAASPIELTRGEKRRREEETGESDAPKAKSKGRTRAGRNRKAAARRK